MMGGSLIAYHSRGQKNVTLSTAESEYVALSGCVQEVIWTRRVLSFLGFPVRGPTTVYEDNEAAQALACNEIMTKRSRFVDARFHYVREMVNENDVHIQRCDWVYAEIAVFRSLSSRLRFPAILEIAPPRTPRAPISV